MATTIPVQAPITFLPSSGGSGPIASLPIGATHITDARFVKLSSGLIVPIATDDHAHIVGIIQHDSASVFAQQDTGLQGVFGADQVGTGLFPATPGQALVATLGPPVLAIANLPATTGWISGGTHQATWGTTVGLVHGTTFDSFDDQSGNPIGSIVGVLTLDGNCILGPPLAATPVDPTGLLGARVLVAFTLSVLDIVQGQ